MEKEHKNYHLIQADNLRYPVLISVPHAGRHYPRQITDNLRIPADALLRLEDRYVDMLSRSAAETGFAVITAKAPRAWIDMNRAPDDIDAAMLADADSSQFPGMSSKARGGLGLIPRRLSGFGDIWHNKWLWQDIRTRIAEHHAPYHSAIAGILRAMQRQYGAAVLLDLHSMPSLPVTHDAAPAQVVLGDRFGAAASSQMSEAALAVAERHGFTAQLNHPYAGGYILQRHAAPMENVHALQLEIDRSLYLDLTGREPAHGVHAVSAMVREIALAVADEAGRLPELVAAE
ncbi:N-formylglutamate amidohydrolase [Sphingorhabdus sp. Alg239-R122]|uniref:N-formylglutamate amidohydrolase n=1 Tax=Sphingorhabdus sp. Alg239-R122 TaxID=2305989 RepID=UPI0013DA777C|nr:N-formylglutamate amidohydrolase [Sphingorhabdus sp. Alg239-R122]